MKHVGGLPNFETQNPGPHWVKRLKRLKCEEEVWWLRIPSEFHAMRSLTSHLWVYGVGKVTWWFDVRWLTAKVIEHEQVIHSHVVRRFRFRFELYVGYVDIFLKIDFGALVCCHFFFQDSHSEKMSLLVRFFGETPLRQIVTCLLLRAARDLKSSQCAVHVVGPVHCTQRTGHTARKNHIFWSIDSWNMMLLVVYYICNS